MAGSEDDIPPPPPSQTPTQQTPHTVSTIKLPILKKGEYDIWAMKMEHYLAHTDYPIWEVIQRGNGPVSVSTDTNGLIKVLPPKTAEEILARERERKARTTLLMALPEDHLAKFHKMTDAKEIWEAIKYRFGENDESKKMQKYILKQQFEGFSVSNSKGLHKGYDRFQSLLSQLEIHGAGVSTEDANQKFLRSLPSAWSQVSLIMRTKPGVDSLSFDDLYNNLRVFESDVKGSTASSSSTWNVAFVSENTRSTKDGILLEEADPNRIKIVGRRVLGTLGNKGKKMGEIMVNGGLKALVTLDGEGVDWTSHSEDEQENYALMACSSSGSDTEPVQFDERHFGLQKDIMCLMASMGSLLFWNTGTIRPESGWENSEALIIDCLSIVETDKVNHAVETDIVKLVVEIESFGMNFDEFDKETGSSDGLQPKQADLNCVHALNELHLHETRVIPNVYVNE
ncbi:hypothetical protein Tco_0715481 [Tanacetum coccineum]